MNLQLRRIAVLVVLGSVFTSSRVGAADAQTISIASDTSWTVYDGDPANLASVGVLGQAERVCLNASAPYICPSDAVQYGHSSPGWGADLTPIPAASWIWGPGVTATTFPADLKQFFFSKTFFVPGRPTAGSVLVAVDDLAEVLVNGRTAGVTGSITDFAAAALAQSRLVSFDVSSLLVAGANTITIRGQNGPSWFAGSQYPTTYGQNPAGVVFGGSLSYEPIAVSIDIKPGSNPNSINMSAHGTVAVAIFGSATFDVRNIDPSSLSLAGAPVAVRGNGSTMYGYEDVNGDGLLDLVVHFDVGALQLTVVDSSAVLLGRTLDGLFIRGVDSVRIVP